MGCSMSRGGEAQGQSDLRGVVASRDPPNTVPRVKLVLLGDTGVGKSCLVLRYVRGQFDPGSKVTIGAAYMSHSTTLDTGATVRFEIWDTAGQERYRSLAPLYYRGAGAAAVVFDITDTDSFAKAQYWVSELQKTASPDIVIVLVGNKADLEGQRAVSHSSAQSYADANGMLFVEASAKSSAGVAHIFEVVAAKLTAPQLPTSMTSAGDFEDDADVAAVPPLQTSTVQ